MNRALAIVLGTFLLAAACVSRVPRESAETVAKRTAVALEFNDGTCSGTVVAPSVILTASHCFGERTILLTVNREPVEVVEIAHDGADHALVTVNRTFPQWARLAGEPSQGDAVFFYGNPIGLRDLLRRGYVMGTDGRFVFTDIMSGPGDSGAGVFNQNGELVGVVYGYGMPPTGEPVVLGLMAPIVPGFLKPVAK